MSRRDPQMREEWRKLVEAGGPKLDEAVRRVFVEELGCSFIRQKEFDTLTAKTPASVEEFAAELGKEWTLFLGEERLILSVYATLAHWKADIEHRRRHVAAAEAALTNVEALVEELEPLLETAKMTTGEAMVKSGRWILERVQ
jgi:hypothetical protein